VGAGTAFTILLPRAEQKAITAVTPALPAAARMNGTEIIVVVEDEPAVLRSTSRILRDAGYTVVEAANGMAAREVIARQPHVDLVLTDVMMPGMTGMQLAEILAVEQPQVKIMFMTGHADDRAIYEHAPRQVLFKPFRSADILGKIREVLGTGYAASPAASRQLHDSKGA
jgi:CheY-like chemotaxis protein